MPYVYSVRRRQPAKAGAMAILPPDPPSVAKAEVVSADAVVAVEVTDRIPDAPVEIPTTPKPRKPRAKKSDG